MVNGRSMCQCYANRGSSCGVAVCVVVFGYCGVRGHACVYVSVCLQRDGRTALYQASQQGKDEVVEVLLSSGAAVNAARV